MNSETSNDAAAQTWVCNKCGRVIAFCVGGVPSCDCSVCGGTFILTDMSHDSTPDVIEEGAPESAIVPRRILLENNDYLELDERTSVIRRFDGYGLIQEVRCLEDEAYGEWSALFCAGDPSLPAPEQITIRGDTYMDILGQVVALAEKLGNCELELAVKFQPKHMGRNDLCSCGSGKKFKKCCWLTGVAPEYKTVPRESYDKDAPKAVPEPEAKKQVKVGGRMRGRKR